MNQFKNILLYFHNIQIYSALIWAITIIISSIIVENKNLSILLITAAGFHMVLMSNSKKNTQNSKV